MMLGVDFGTVFVAEGARCVGTPEKRENAVTAQRELPGGAESARAKARAESFAVGVRAVRVGGRPVLPGGVSREAARFRNGAELVAGRNRA